MKILLLISENWNDALHPNNNLTNWFEGMDGVEIATIYLSPGLPQNKCCKKYFRATEGEMVKSFFPNNGAGKVFVYDDYPTCSATDGGEYQSTYQLFKRVSCEPIRLIRDIIWAAGKYNQDLIKKFINDFNPDVVFSQRMGSIKMCRLERIVMKFCKAPIVAYTGDDEYSLRHISLSPTFWLRRFWLRSELRKNIPRYDLFYSMSSRQMEEFKRAFGVRTKFLVKCGNFEESKIHRAINSPIVLTYAGKLYCGRWKTLALLAGYIKRINRDKQIFKLQIFTSDKITRRISHALDDGVNSSIQPAVTREALKIIYSESDILLHVESLKMRHSLSTKYSFSTKIMDCMSSGCAIMAIGRKEQAGCAYLKDNDAAFVATDESGICDTLQRIAVKPNLVLDFANKAYVCGASKHPKSIVQRMILEDFMQLCRPE